jgi:hypothetical protein
MIKNVLTPAPTVQQRAARNPGRFGPGYGDPGYGGPDPYAEALTTAGVQDALPIAPKGAFTAFNKLFHHYPGPEKPWSVGLVIDYAEALLATPASAGKSGWTGGEGDALVVQLLQWATDTDVRGTNTLICLICRDDIGVLPGALLNPEAKIESIYVPYPNHAERVSFLQWFFETAPDFLKETLKDPPIQQLANQTAGLPYQLIEDCMLRSSQAGCFDPYIVKERKDSVIKQRYHDVIEIAEPEHGKEAVGGLDEIWELLVRDVAKPMREGNLQRVPMGVLMSGPPGTGKSVIAEALAKEAGVLFMILRMAKIFTKWVGESEKNLEKILMAAVSMAPCIMFMDEIDQAGHRRGAEQTDSGVGSRVFQRFLEFMSDTHNRGRIVVLAATNRPDLLDSAMKRAGRFDVHLPFFAPSGPERGAIVKAICRKNGLRFKGKVSDDLIARTEGWVGADIEALVTAARNYVEDTKGDKDVVTGSALEEIVQYRRPSISALEIELMSYLAFRETIDYRLLPKHWQDKIRSQQTKDKPLSTAEHLRKTGFTDEQLAELGLVTTPRAPKGS